MLSSVDIPLISCAVGALIFVKTYIIPCIIPLYCDGINGIISDITNKAVEIPKKMFDDKQLDDAVDVNVVVLFIII